MLESVMHLNVLIVDDNHAAAELLRELLELQEHKAQCVYNGQQALDAAADRNFDVALVDLTLPDMPGTSVAQRLRVGRGNGSAPLLVAVSGHAPSDATRGLFDYHLQKPIDLQALDRILARAM